MAPDKVKQTSTPIATNNTNGRFTTKSPFRYPGGKSWLIPEIRKWLAPRHGRRTVLVEPFAGGAAVGLSAAIESLVSKVILVELDDDVAAVWHTLIQGDGETLAQMVRDFAFSDASVSEMLARQPESEEERAFITLLRNRVNHGGKMAAGAGLLKNGENHKGLKSRWYPQTISQRILDIVAVKDRLEFFHGDGLSVLERYRQDRNAMFFIDPPYVAAGERLYTHSDVDHEAIFRLASEVRGSFLMTYDHHRGIQELADRFGFQIRELRMMTTHHNVKTELLISRNFAWYDAPAPTP